MRQIKEILRLRFEHKLSIREIAGSCSVPASTVGDYLKRAEAAGLGCLRLDCHQNFDYLCDALRCGNRGPF